MLHFTRRYEGDRAATLVLGLTLDRRRHSRLRARVESGDEVGIVLAHGSILRHGDRLIADDGTVMRIEAAPERLSVVKARDPLLLARAAYHLGNRHVPLELGDGFLRYQHDHVLDDMVRALGIEIAEDDVAFEPEVGPYAHGSHSHEREHAHDHDHDQGHDHDHEDDHHHGHPHRGHSHG
jgi:urease accessory protein